MLALGEGWALRGPRFDLKSCVWPGGALNFSLARAVCIPREAGKLNFYVKYPTLKILTLGFSGGAVVENLPANAGDTGLSPGLGRSHMPRSS